MTQIDYTRAAKYFLLADFVKGFKLGLKYFFAPKATVNYPQGKLEIDAVVAYLQQLGTLLQSRR